MIMAGSAFVLYPSAACAEESVFITEFMAANRKTLADRDRQFSDWIEIYNAGASAVNLEGWYLTDKQSDLRRWKFPATPLAANSYLLVFASQKNRRQPGAELHTNFKLSTEGGYLALVKPDGVTIASEFAAPYPEQFADVSYGLAMSDLSIPLFTSNATKRILVPSADLGTNWVMSRFDDNGWNSGRGGVGYAQASNYVSLIDANIRKEMFGRNASAYIRVPFALSNDQVDRVKLRLRYKDGFIAYLNGAEIARRNAPAAPQWNSTATGSHGPATAGLLEEKFQSPAGGYTLNQIYPNTRSRISRAAPGGGANRTEFSPDGKRIVAADTDPAGGSFLRLANGRVNGQVNSIAFDQTVVGLSETIVAEFDFRFKSFGETAAADSLSFLLIPTATFDPKGVGVRVENLQNNKPPNLPGIFAVRLQFLAQANQNVVSLHWNGSERASIKLPVGAYPFVPRTFHRAKIALKHAEQGGSVSVTLTSDVNGPSSRTFTVVEQKLIPGLAPFENRVQIVSCVGNVASTIDLANIRCQFVPPAGLPFEEFDASRFAHLLRPGTNLLAIQGFNRAADEPDFLIMPELTAQRVSLQTKSPRYFATATPAGPNGDGVAGVSGRPRFSIAGGIYTNDLALELHAESPTTTIRYTLDGAEPTLSSDVYSSPIKIRGSTLVKAKSFELGLLPSPTTAETYTLLDSSLLSFDSNLPLVVINSFNQYIYRGRKVPVSLRFVDTQHGRSSLAGPADFDGRGDIHARGHSSLHFPKHSYTFHLRDETKKTKVSLLGMPKDSDWVLYAPFTDKTLMRDVLAYELSNKMGHYASRTKFVEVFIGRSGGKLGRSDYAGVYVLEEKIKRAKKRVNIAELTPGDNAEPGISGGYIIKRDHSDNWSPGYSTSFSTSRGVHFFFVEPKGREVTPQQRSWMAGYMNNFERALYGPNFADPASGYAAYLDVDSFIDQHWLIEMSKNIDGFRYSVFLNKDRGGKLKLEPVWDWNLSFGNADYYNAYEPTGWYTPLLRETEICWFRRLIQDPEFAQRYADRWGELRSNLFAPANLLGRVDELAALLNQAQARNFQRWPIMGRSIKPSYFTGDTYQAEVNWMKQWIQRRIAWIDSQFLAPPQFNRRDAGGGTLLMRAPAGKIYYTVDGSDPRLPGGGISPKARLYNSPISPAEGAQLFARVLHSNAWSSPTKANLGMRTARTAAAQE